MLLVAFAFDFVSYLILSLYIYISLSLIYLSLVCSLHRRVISQWEEDPFMRPFPWDNIDCENVSCFHECWNLQRAARQGGGGAGILMLAVAQDHVITGNVAHAFLVRTMCTYVRKKIDIESIVSRDAIRTYVSHTRRLAFKESRGWFMYLICRNCFELR